MLHSLNLVVDELARQVKRHRDKLRHRREADRAAAARSRAAVTGVPPTRHGSRSGCATARNSR